MTKAAKMSTILTTHKQMLVTYKTLEYKDDTKIFKSSHDKHNSTQFV